MQASQIIKRPRAGNGEGSFTFIEDTNLWRYRITIDMTPDGKTIRKSFYGTLKY